jgi:diguanylate cyclase (GGDEF)-like protein/PAS domain S-box-containing protein
MDNPVSNPQNVLSIINGMQTLTAFFEVDGSLLFANSALLKISNLDLQKIIGTKFWDCSWWTYDHQVQTTIQNACLQAAAGNSTSQQVQFNTVDGLQRIKLNLFPVHDENDHIIFLALEASLLDDHSQTSKPVLESENLYTTLFQKSADALLLIEDDKFIDCNPATITMLGYQSKEEFLNLHPSQLSPIVQSDGTPSFEKANEMMSIAFEKGSHRFEWEHLRQNNEIFPVEVLLTAIPFGGKELLHVVWRDITERKKQEDRLEYIAHYDVLTQLPNRTLFADHFQQAIAHCHRTKLLLAIAFLDIDDFKPVNDNYGHDVGDRLLIEVAKRIKSLLREEDTVSRQGGDEFALLLGEITSISAGKQLFKRIHQSLSQPYLIDGQAIQISASTGITFYPLDTGDIDTLIRHADQAMYQAKLAGKNQFHLFSIEDDQQLITRQTQLHEIELALTNTEFQLFYQPKVNMKTGEVLGVEALIRWLHPIKGLIPPLRFLPIIDSTDLEIHVGDWVINEAVAQLDIWQKQGLELEVSINISSHHLLSDSFFSQLNDALTKYPDVDSRLLQLEILESSTLGDLNAISKIIKLCQGNLGINIALDDFGTGYSSLTHLRNLPVNTIKVDQTFIQDMLDDPSDYAIVDGVIGLADAFDREVIAEGVESIEHGLMLLLTGCEQAQGYGIAKPMAASNVSEWVTNYTPNQNWVDCGNETLSDRKSKIKLFKLITNHWKDKFVTNIQSSPEDIHHWPIMDSQHCHCGQWLKRAKESQLFEPQWLTKLNTVHEEIHTIAGALLLKYQHGDIVAAREGLATLNSTFDEMKALLLSY